MLYHKTNTTIHCHETCNEKSRQGLRESIDGISTKATNKQNNIGETYTPIDKLTTTRYLISGWELWMESIMNIVTVIQKPEINDDDIYAILPEGIHVH